MSDTPLAGLPGWSDAHIERLRSVWVTTAEQVVALGATPVGLRSLGEELGAPPHEVRRMVDAARAALPPTVRAEMEQPVDTGDYGLGVLPPADDRVGGPHRSERREP